MWKRKGNSNRFMEASPAKEKTFPFLPGLIGLITTLAVLLLAMAIMYNAPLRFSIAVDETMADRGAESVITEKLPLLSAVRYMGYSSEDAASADPAHMRWYEAQLPGCFSLGTNACALCLARFGNESGRLEEIQVYVGMPNAIERAVLRYDASFQKDE